MRQTAAEVDPDDEVDLVRRASSGDGEAFAVLVSKYRRLVDAACATVVSDRTDREDAIQVALLDAWRGLPSFQGDAKFSTWLFRVAQNAARRQMRRHLRAVPTAAEDLAGTDSPGERDHGRADGWEDALDTRAIVVAAVEALPEDQRDALLLHTQCGLPLQEIADMKIVALGTVKAWIHRARTEIARALDSAAVIPPGTPPPPPLGAAP